MKTSDKGRAFIEAFEGLFLHTYNDGTGVLTIGYGHTSAAGPPRVYQGMTITKEQADAILAADLASVEVEVEHLVKVPLNQNQFDALVSFHFNTGWLGHHGCSLLRQLNSKNYDLAAADFALYERAGGQIMRGLVRRRHGEMEMFKGNVETAMQIAGVKLVA
jgi:lysozyme